MTDERMAKVIHDYFMGRNLYSYMCTRRPGAWWVVADIGFGIWNRLGNSLRNWLDDNDPELQCARHAENVQDSLYRLEFFRDTDDEGEECVRVQWYLVHKVAALQVLQVPESDVLGTLDVHEFQSVFDTYFDDEEETA